jgi:hypothetical protein
MYASAHVVYLQCHAKTIMLSFHGQGDLPGYWLTD